MCGEQVRWIRVDKTKKGFSVGKAVAGRLLFGPEGLVAGALGKKKSTYCCGRCGFTHEYDGYAQSIIDRGGVQYMQRCPNCGNFFQPGSNFCSVCGTSLMSVNSLNNPYRTNYAPKDYWKSDYYSNKKYLGKGTVQPALQQPPMERSVIQQPSMQQQPMQQPPIQQSPMQQQPMQQQPIQQTSIQQQQPPIQQQPIQQPVIRQQYTQQPTIQQTMQSQNINKD